MKSIAAIVPAVLLVLLSACAPRVNDPADVQAVRQTMNEFSKAINAGDADAVAALMTDTTIYADLNLPVVTGRQAIRSLYQSTFSQGKTEFNAPVEDVRAEGNLAVARGTWTATTTPNAEGVAPVSDGGSWIVVLARQTDGSWKWDWVVPNSNQPLPGYTASGEEEQALYQLERDWAAASMKKDAAAVDGFLANEFVSNFDGRIQNKRQFLAEMKANPAEIESATNSEMKAMVFGDTAIVRGLYIEKSTTRGKDSSGELRYTEVYVKRDGRWQCVTQYATRFR